ncbi:MAG TPA: cobaltochelatase subunit CobS, partial [Rhodospirillaceae bacterium]|nr:cobaltochelatase subunit CobS [Rhodospirillaceae bacterium]
IAWIENMNIFKNREIAFQLSFLNKCDETERPIIAEYYQRCFNVELPASTIRNLSGSQNRQK